MLLRLFPGLVIVSISSLCFGVSASADELIPNAFYAVDPVFDSRIYIEQWGDPDNPPVVLVHGLGDNGARDWRHLAPELAETFYVTAFDLPGFGRSEKRNALYTPDTYTRVLAWLVDEYVDGRFALIGHSMGGAIALNYASAHSNDLTRLVLIDAAGILHRTAFTKHLIDDLKLPGNNSDEPGNNLEALNDYLGFSLEDIDRYPAALDAVLRSPVMRGALLGGDPRLIAGFALVQHNFSGRLRQVTVPTLVIWGGEDAVTPLRTGRLLAHRLPLARLEVIDGVGHLPMYESTGRLNRLVLDELNSSTDWYLTEPAKRVFAATAEEESCDGESGRFISGRYTRVTIVNCKRVLIEDSEIDELIIRNSSVEIMTSIIGDGAIAVGIDNSFLMATATDFRADRTFVVSSSRLDLAGVKIFARKTPFQAGEQSTVLFSVSNVRTPEYARHVHGVFFLSPSENPF